MLNLRQEPPPTPFRCTRVLLALGPLAGTLGALLGVALGIDGSRGIALLPMADLSGLGATAYFGGCLLTLMAIVVGKDRGRPLHSLKASATIAALLFLPGLAIGALIAGAGC